MKVIFTKNGWNDFEYWIENDTRQVKKIKELIKSIRNSPFEGLGKPELLKHQLKGFWSRRINQEHRLIYQIKGKNKSDQICTIYECRYHYHT